MTAKNNLQKPKMNPTSISIQNSNYRNKWIKKTVNKTV